MMSLSLLAGTIVVTGIQILIGSLRCLKEAKAMDMVLVKCIFQNRFP